MTSKFYLIKSDCVNNKCSMVGQYGGRGEALEALYGKLQEYDENNKIVIERDELGGKACIYLYGSLWGKTMVEYYQIIDFNFKSELTKSIENQGYKIQTVNKKEKIV